MYGNAFYSTLYIKPLDLRKGIQSNSDKMQLITFLSTGFTSIFISDFLQYFFKFIKINIVTSENVAD